MAETTPRSNADEGTPPRMPRWVKTAAIVVGLLILIFVVLQLTGVGGKHGPGQHMSGAPAPATTSGLTDSPSPLLR